ncbi:MAG: DUF1116 domain-containing protein, partial [Oscillospiraceae bacterium]
MQNLGTQELTTTNLILRKFNHKDAEALFEGWAENAEVASMLLKNGDVTFIPCHHVNAVGPMGGITSAHMPVFVV